MLFNSKNINFEIVSVLNLNLEKNYGESGIRAYNALSFRVSGDAKFIHKNGFTHVKSGDIIFVPAFYEYTVQAQEEELFVIHFVSDGKLSDTITTFHSKNPQYYERKLQELYIAWSKKQYGYEYECKAIVYRILFHIEREFAESAFSSTEDSLHDAIDYIHENFTSKTITVDYLSNMCGMSDTYFRRLFVRRFGVTPLKYINNLKLNYAKELLRSGYYTVSQASDKCGFDSIQYFSLFIKRETGLPPSAYMVKELKSKTNVSIMNF